MEIDLVDGLLQTSIILNYNGQSITIDKLVVDTGASHTLLSADIVSEIGVFFKTGDEIVHAFGIGGEESCFRKRFDVIQLGSFQIENFKVDIGTLHEKLSINGLIGLDLLIRANIILNLLEFKMYPAIVKKD